jgi:glycosyltransferase involved in cell wall biosynthesis
MTLISVIIPTYNRAHLLGETLSSILNQTLPADEIIVVDDGSTDDTAKASEAAFAKWERRKVKGQKSPEFKFIRQENAGPAAARNAGFSISKGEFIHFFDSDDLAAPNKHEVQLKALEESGADIAYAPWVKGNICDGTFTPENHVLQQCGLPSEDNAELIKALLTDWSIVPHACIFRRLIVEKAAGFPEYLFGTEDQMMFLNCLLAGATVVHSPGTLELYRTGESAQITAAGEGKKRHALNWAKFLVDADQACQMHGIMPRAWFGFRGRAWEALGDLKTFSIDHPELAKSLKQIKGDETPDVFYALARELKRKMEGLRLRVGGCRANTSFKSAHLTVDQRALIEEMGIRLLNNDLT